MKGTIYAIATGAFYVCNINGGKTLDLKHALLYPYIGYAMKDMDEIKKQNQDVEYRILRIDYKLSIQECKS